MLLDEIDLSPTCKLVHYSKDLVPVYHSWFEKYPELLDLTASEPLSLEEELANQDSWVNDPHKVTFIILDAEAGPCGDVNCFLTEDSGEINVMIAEPTARRKGLAKTAVTALMKAVHAKFEHVNKFVAKINQDNAPSIAMFQGLGFVHTRTVEVFGEVHYEKTL